MWHKSREWTVREYESLEDLTEAITQFDWTLCTGHKVGNLLFLNDAFTEDSVQEYAVFRYQPDGELHEVETFSVSWMTRERFKAAVSRLPQRGAPVQPRIDASPSHRCELCM